MEEIAMAFYPSVKVLMAYADTSVANAAVMLGGVSGWIDISPGDNNNMFTMMVNALVSGSLVSVQTNDTSPDHIYRAYLSPASTTAEEKAIIEKAAAEKKFPQ